MHVSEIDQTRRPPGNKLAAVFVSDTHLQADSPHTAEAFLDFLGNTAMQARQLYLLGDLFEYWAGDDDLDAPFTSRIVNALRAVSNAGVELFWMAGNRDFLVDAGFMQATGATMLEDPSVVVIAGQSIVLTHGDAQCTDDIDYQAFRAQVRTEAWQQEFLAMPLEKRLAIIAQMRQQSQAAQRIKMDRIMDVNSTAIIELFATTGASSMIHGHTHRPASHEAVVDGKQVFRHVLPDWDFENGAARGGGIGIHENGVIERLTPSPS